MIIIKTNNGARFVNEAETLQVNHMKDKAQVEVWPSRWGNQPQQPQYYIIENVEAVIYTNKETTWTDEGSELLTIQQKLDESRKALRELRNEFMECDKERDELKAKVAKLQDRVNELEGINKGIQHSDAPTDTEHKITLRATSPVGSDCTQAFDVDGCEGMTVRDFIQAVIKRDPYVDIDIRRDGNPIWSGEYTKQVPQIFDAHIKPLSEEQLLLKVKSARAAGGWGRMSYNIKLY